MRGLGFDVTAAGCSRRLCVRHRDAPTALEPDNACSAYSTQAGYGCDRAIAAEIPDPGLGGLVALALAEIRQFGCSSIQVARRLQEELTLLDREVERDFKEPANRMRAREGDAQGFRRALSLGCFCVYLKILIY